MKAQRILLAGAAVLLASEVWSEDRTVSLTDVMVVQDGEGSSRVFFRLGQIPFSESTLIERAVLTMPFTGSAAERAIELRVCPVTEAWGTPAFDTPHDASVSGRCEIDLRGGSGLATFDLTVALKESLEDGVFSDGFVLLARSEGPTGSDLARFGTLSGAQLNLSTITLPSGKPPRDREGSTRRPAKGAPGQAR